MWVSLFIAVITYLLSDRGTSEERRDALRNAAIAGGAAYIATETTDWGADISSGFDDLIGVGGPATESTVDAAGNVVLPPKPANSPSTWDSFKGWAAGLLGVAGAGSLIGADIPWGLIIGGIATLYILS